MKTMTDLWDAIVESVDGHFVAEDWLREWKTLGDEVTFAEWCAFEATELQVRNLLEDLIAFFRERIQGISGEELYSMTLREGREAMNRIADIADRFGDGFGNAARAPATLPEALVMSSAARVAP
jgi:hypothetical protein